jgi:tryptophan synthase alpha chain
VTLYHPGERLSPRTGGTSPPFPLAVPPAKVLMPYITGGVRPDWTDCLAAFEDAGADMIEVGLPFSDPTVDGPTIQEASGTALARGATPASVLAELAAIRTGIPLIASTYANIALRPGFTAALAAACVTGLIVPDVPLDELDGLDVPGIEVSLLASPATPDDRLAEIGRRSRGFVYAVSVMGTTGERRRLAPSAAALAVRVKQVTDLPVLLGFGISTPAQAAEAAAVADGVIVGAAVMRRILDGAGPAEAGAFVASLRAALSRPAPCHDGAAR